MRRLLSRLAAPPGLFYYGMLVTAVAVLCFQGRAQKRLSDVGLCVVAWAVLLALRLLGLLWLISAVVWFVRLRRCVAHSRPSTPWARWVLAIPLFVVGDAADALDPRARFWASRPLMERFARQVAALPPGAAVPSQRRLGFVHAERIERIPGGIRFTTYIGGRWLDHEGLAFSPGAPPPDERGYYYSHRTGDWYTFFHQDPGRASRSSFARQVRPPAV